MTNACLPATCSILFLVIIRLGDISIFTSVARVLPNFEVLTRRQQLAANEDKENKVKGKGKGRGERQRSSWERPC